jgi:hypothetical protein
VYYNGARPYFQEETAVIEASEPELHIVEDGQGVYLRMVLGQAPQNARTTFVTAELLGTTKISRAPFENPDGSPLMIDADYFGRKRKQANPTAGPFEDLDTGPCNLGVW